MRKTFSVLMLLIASFAFADSTSDFEFYKSIPKYESITLNGQEISIVIKSNYSVSMSASKNDSYTKSELRGTGTVSWDPNEKRIYLQLNGNISGSYSRDEDVYTTERKYNVGSGTLNFLFGDGAAQTYRTERSYDHTEYYRAKGSDNFSIKIPMKISSDKRYYTLSSRSLSVSLQGNTSQTVYYSINGEQRSLSYGSAKTTGNTSNDEFGAWQWTKDKSHIYLHSTNIQSTRLSIYRSDSIPFELVLRFKGPVEGLSSSYAGGSKLMQFNFSFEDGANVPLSFVEQGQEKWYTYTYAIYNRFMEEWNFNATSLIDQIKGKQTLIVSYKSNGSSYSAIFELEGLEAIMQYLQPND